MAVKKNTKISQIIIGQKNCIIMVMVVKLLAPFHGQKRRIMAVKPAKNPEFDG
jgi:hypothetical protein